MSREPYSSAFERSHDRLTERWAAWCDRRVWRHGRLEALPDVMGIALSFAAFGLAFGALGDYLVEVRGHDRKVGGAVLMPGGFLGWFLFLLTFTIRKPRRVQARNRYAVDSGQEPRP